MAATLALIVPLGLGAAASPMLLTEQTVLLAGRDGRRAGLRFALGAVAVLVSFVLAILLFGRSISLPTEPKLDATLDLVLGLALLAVAAAIHVTGRRHGDRPPPGPKQSRWSRAAFPFGAFSMATNFTTLALVLPAAKEISVSEAGTAGRAVLVAVLVALAAIPAWVPVLLTRLAPGPGQRVLTAISDFIARHGRATAAILVLVAGLFFSARGIERLLG